MSPDTPPRRHAMQRLLLGLACGALLALPAACSGERTVHVDGSKLQQRLDSRFPLDKRLLGLASITISNPRLSFDTAANQLGTQFTLAMPSVLGMTPALAGTVNLAYGLRYELADNSVRMIGVQVKSVEMKDEQGRSNSSINNALSLLGEQLFQDYPLYRLTEADLAKVRQYNYVPASVTVTRNGLDVLLVPRR